MISSLSIIRTHGRLMNYWMELGLSFDMARELGDSFWSNAINHRQYPIIESVLREARP